MGPDVDEAWAELRNCLEARSRELHDEVHSYPTPIARCDEQLPHLIAQRDAAFRLLREAGALDVARPRLAPDAWLSRLRVFAAGVQAVEDAALLAARERFVAT